MTGQDPPQALVDADDRDLPWLLDQYATAGIQASHWWLAGQRLWGYPPPPRSACAPDLQARLDAVISGWQR